MKNETWKLIWEELFVKLFWNIVTMLIVGIICGCAGVVIVKLVFWICGIERLE